MQNFQLIVLSVWEPTDKITHLHACTPLGLCALHVEIKGELNKQKYYTN